MQDIIICTLCISLILIIYLIYRHNIPKNLDNQIMEKKETIKLLDKEISDKGKELKQLEASIDSNINNVLQSEIAKINYKTDLLLQKNNKDNSDIPFIIIIITISTLVILYFLYRWTYLIQPERIQELKNQFSGSINNLFQ